MITKVTLASIAHGRSGDKGNHANIAVLAYTPTGFNWIRKHLTAEVVQRYFANLNTSRVLRYEAANVLGLNFVLYDVLAGGVVGHSHDTQGKTLALALLHMEIEPGVHFRAMGRRRPKLKDKEHTKVVEELREIIGMSPIRKRRKKDD